MTESASLRYKLTPPDRYQRFEITISNLTNEESNEVLTVLDRIQWRRRQERLTVEMKAAKPELHEYNETDR